jgi:hypothetical protein
MSKIASKLILYQNLKNRAIWGPLGIAVMLNTGESLSIELETSKRTSN